MTSTYSIQKKYDKCEELYGLAKEKLYRFSELNKSDIDSHYCVNIADMLGYYDAYGFFGYLTNDENYLDKALFFFNSILIELDKKFTN